MCGICGFNWKDEKLIKRMVEKIRHRGPDAQGTKTFEEASIANARLSIIDLSPKGNQPMSNDDGTKWIVYNGEIYNFPEIRKELEKKGYKFKSSTDTEVVLKSYEEYGVKCLDKFNGMFGFAIWDIRKKELFIARDRIGIKPLYYYYKNGDLIFGSEIKTILESEKVSKKINLQSLYYYLGYEFVPAPLTLFENIYKLPQGHYAVLKEGNLTVKKYWDLNFEHKNLSEEEFAEELFEILKESVRKRLISDVPVGVFLSGGLDSSTVTGFVAQMYGKKLQTFSIGYDDPTFSELPYAEKISKYFNTEHNVLIIKPISPEDIEKSIYHLDEPMTDLSTIPFYLISCKAREQVKVCLSGEGGDEIFLGYDRFKAAKLNSYYGIIPKFIRTKLIAPLILSLPDQPQKKGAINMLKRFIEGSLYPDEVGAMRWQFFMNPSIEKNIFSDRIYENVKRDPFEPIYKMRKACSSNNNIEKDIYVDIKLTMADSVLMKVDKMSMATSLEVRVPFLDHKVVEYCASIPPELKLKGFTTKYILRKSLERKKFYPKDMIYRGKQGYSLPVKNWLRNEMKDYMLSLFNESRLINQFINKKYLNTLINEHLSKKHNHNHILWALINAAIWHKKFFKE